MGEKPRLERIRSTRPGDMVVRRKQREIRRLPRVLGVPALFSIVYANIGTSIYYALGVIALYALGAAPLALLIAGVLFIFTALSYAEGTVAIPEAGGSSSLARHAFNELISFICGWALLLSYIVTISISALSAGGYLSVFFPILDIYPFDVLFAVGIILGMMTLNVIGFHEAANFNILFVIIDLLIQIIVVLFGTVLLLNPELLLNQVQFGIAPTWGQFLLGISIATIAFTGIETASNLAEETKEPTATIPRAFGLAIFAIIILYMGISTIALSALPVQHIDGLYTTELGTKFISFPVVGIAHVLPEPFDHILEPLIAVAASFILVVTTNTGIMGISRASFSMGAHMQIPAILHKVHPRFRTPYVAIITGSVIACILALLGSIAILADLYAFGAMLAFTVAHASVVGLRMKYPSMEKPFKLPFNIPFKGREIPAISVIGGIGTFAIWLIVITAHPLSGMIGATWYLVGVLLFVGYRKRVGLNLTGTASPTG